MILIALVCLVYLSIVNRVTPSTIQEKTVIEKVRYLIKKDESKYSKILFFHSSVNNRGNGKLLIIDLTTLKIEASYKARSGIGGKESQKAFGPIPSNTLINESHYRVNVNPLWLNKKGINGNFYQIFPYSVSIKGVNRGDFGIHLDVDNNGTLGCIGIVASDWEKFKTKMTQLHNKRISKIPLLIDNL